MFLRTEQEKLSGLNLNEKKNFFRRQFDALKTELNKEGFSVSIDLAPLHHLMPLLDDLLSEKSEALDYKQQVISARNELAELKNQYAELERKFKKTQTLVRKLESSLVKARQDSFHYFTRFQESEKNSFSHLKEIYRLQDLGDRKHSHKERSHSESVKKSDVPAEPAKDLKLFDRRKSCPAAVLLENPSPPRRRLCF